MIRNLIPGLTLATLLIASGATFAASPTNAATGNSPTTAVRHSDTATPATPSKDAPKAKKHHRHHKTAKTAPKQ